MKPYYVLLTGAKNNAGDYLIGSRAKSLLRMTRPDRDLVELPRWKLFTGEDLKLVNESEAVILTGGPALRRNMRPKLFPMAEQLSAIKPPILTMGIGWKSQSLSWEATREYELNADTVSLIRRIEESGYSSSVRDYHTLNVLLHRGFKSFRMTGCPALFAPHGEPSDSAQSDSRVRKLAHVAFSVGARIGNDSVFEKQTQSMIEAIGDWCDEGRRLTVFFHHSLEDSYLQTDTPNVSLHEAQRRLAVWLTRQGISYQDVSGGHEALLRNYASCDIHIGYRVHAHVLMSSLSKPSILIAEDGRGAALREVLAGLVLPAFVEGDQDTILQRRDHLRALISGRSPRSSRSLVEGAVLAGDAIRNAEAELASGFARAKATEAIIARHREHMEKFLLQLP